MANIVLVGSVLRTEAGLIRDRKQQWTLLFAVEKVLKGHAPTMGIAVTYWRDSPGVSTTANPPKVELGRHVLFLSTEAGNYKLITPFHGAKRITEVMGAFDETRKGEIVTYNGGHSSINGCPYVRMTEDEYVEKICSAANTQPILINAPLPPNAKDPNRTNAPKVEPAKPKAHNPPPARTISLVTYLVVVLTAMTLVAGWRYYRKRNAFQSKSSLERDDVGP